MTEKLIVFYGYMLKTYINYHENQKCKIQFNLMQQATERTKKGTKQQQLNLGMHKITLQECTYNNI